LLNLQLLALHYDVTPLVSIAQITSISSGVASSQFTLKKFRRPMGSTFKRNPDSGSGE
jgi:hypothetical protein